MVKRLFSSIVDKIFSFKEETIKNRPPYEIEVFVRYREGMLEPEAEAVKGSLQQLGFSSLNNLRKGKYFVAVVNEPNEILAKEKMEAMCEKLLANPVTESYGILSIKSLYDKIND